MRSCAIVDASPQGSGIEGWVGDLAARLGARGVEVRRFVLRGMTLQQCTGCFECWVRTPGRCRIRDDAEDVLRGVIASDVLVLASPIVMGFTTALLRRAVERLIPLIHPFFDVVDGELHHRPRYPRRPALALVHDGAGLDVEDEALLELLHQRVATSFRTKLALVAPIRQSATEVCDALARL